MDYSIGLSEKEAENAAIKYGENKIIKKLPIQAGAILANQLKSPLIYILFVAAIVNLFLGKLVDSGVILAAVIVNTVLGFIQEFKAESSIESLSSLLVPMAKVRRNKEWKTIEAGTLFPGDVIRLEVGQRIPADGILTRADGLYINEAILTGESLSVEKKEYVFANDFTIYNFQLKGTSEVNKCFMGTVVERGLGEMLVIKTGMNTSLGQIAKDLTRQTIGKTPLMKKLEKLSHLLAVLVVLVIPVITVIGIIRGEDLNHIFLVSLALAISAIPEGLAVGLTVILTVGMNRILKRKALVRKLSAAETLGNIDIICLDKTGTLTEGKMKTTGAVTGLGDDTDEDGSVKMEKIVLGAVLCNDEREPLEVAMMEWARRQLAQSGGQAPQAEWKRIATLPFDYRFKYIVSRHENQKGERIEYISGAPEVVLRLSDNSKKNLKDKWEKKFGELGAKGYRMVGFGYKALEGDTMPRLHSDTISRDEVGGYEWLGVITFEDPVRVGAGESLKRISAANIEVKVITGDYKETAWSVLAATGLVNGDLDPGLVITGDELSTASPARIEKTVLFARVNPEQKLSIVSSLQNLNHVVAMTGDGVNDAPALKQADIGVVVANASDVARETAELILLDSNFETILAAIEEGRGMMDNLRKIVLYLMADAFAGVFLVLLAIIFKFPLPLLATQILWINLISDGFPYMALAVEPKEQGLLLRKPLSRNESIITKPMLLLMLVTSLATGLITLGAFVWSYYFRGDGVVAARTVAMATMGGMTLAYVFSVRSLLKPISIGGLFLNKFLIVGTGVGLMMLLVVINWLPLQMIFGTVAISGQDWWVVGAAAITIVFVIESAKRALRFINKT